MDSLFCADENRKKRMKENIHEEGWTWIGIFRHQLSLFRMMIAWAKGVLREEVDPQLKRVSVLSSRKEFWNKKNHFHPFFKCTKSKQVSLPLTFSGSRKEYPLVVVVDSCEHYLRIKKVVALIVINRRINIILSFEKTCSSPLDAQLMFDSLLQKYSRNFPPFLALMTRIARGALILCINNELFWYSKFHGIFLCHHSGDVLPFRWILWTHVRFFQGLLWIPWKRGLDKLILMSCTISFVLKTIRNQDTLQNWDRFEVPLYWSISCRFHLIFNRSFECPNISEDHVRPTEFTEYSHKLREIGTVSIEYRSPPGVRDYLSMRGLLTRVKRGRCPT